MRRALDGERAAARRVSPLFGLMLAMAPLPLALVAATLAAGTPALTMIGAIGAALTVSLRRGGLLMAVLVLPLTIPGADLRRRRGLGRKRRRGAVPEPVPGAVRAVARRDRACALRRRGGAEAGQGMTSDPCRRRANQTIMQPPDVYRHAMGRDIRPSSALLRPRLV